MLDNPLGDRDRVRRRIYCIDAVNPARQKRASKGVASACGVDQFVRARGDVVAGAVTPHKGAISIKFHDDEGIGIHLV